jgi:hypothetical protein
MKKEPCQYDVKQMGLGAQVHEFSSIMHRFLGRWQFPYDVRKRYRLLCVYLKSFHSLSILPEKDRLEACQEIFDDHHYHETGWTPTEINDERKSWNIYYPVHYRCWYYGLACFATVPGYEVLRQVVPIRLLTNTHTHTHLL